MLITDTLARAISKSKLKEYYSIEKTVLNRKTVHSIKLRQMQYDTKHQYIVPIQSNSPV